MKPEKHGVVTTVISAGLLLTSYAGVAGAAATALPAAEVLQKATAISLGNMAWEGVAVSEVRLEGAKVAWLSTTPTGKWRCQADPDGKRPYCER